MRTPRPATRSAPLPRFDAVTAAVTASALACVAAASGCGPALDGTDGERGQPVVATTGASGGDAVRVDVRFYPQPTPATYAVAPQPAVVPVEQPAVVYVRPAIAPARVYYTPPAPPVQVYAPPVQTVPVIPAPVYPQPSNVHVRGGARIVGPLPQLAAPAS